MREGGVRDAVGGPGAMVIHFWDAAFPRTLSTSVLLKIAMVEEGGTREGKYRPHCLQ